MRQVAEIGARGPAASDLPAPPERIWRTIEAAIADSGRSPAPVRRARRQRRRRLIAVAAVVLALAGTVVADRIVRRAPAQTVIAQAALSPLATVTAQASGSVRVLSDGKMRVEVRHLPLTAGFHEVWLLDPDDLTRMVAIGTLPDRPDAVLPVPPGIDMNRYRLVDISDEPDDGDAAHSGRSLLRGTLTN
ncbi:hypothetical protein Aco04nite_08610 [Winogradskya consettensis]|uniref:Anti-sigma K factor RskA C-terminal domain-containing protein n=1 Tax=Winogradskya consettensis TaxID=113560 RepID=A0A919VLR4_9ACTN|nr:anti-sigma factor [Actinoplanes consettensis]GIM67962.1 hypothetical protein Aco04nite_08610 [Actinoplanes consettensis]